MELFGKFGAKALYVLKTSSQNGHKVGQLHHMGCLVPTLDRYRQHWSDVFGNILCSIHYELQQLRSWKYNTHLLEQQGKNSFSCVKGFGLVESVTLVIKKCFLEVANEGGALDCNTGGNSGLPVSSVSGLMQEDSKGMLSKWSHILSLLGHRRVQSLPGDVKMVKSTVETQGGKEIVIPQFVSVVSSQSY